MAQASSFAHVKDIVTVILEQIHTWPCWESLQLLLETGCLHVHRTDFTRPTLTPLFLYV